MCNLPVMTKYDFPKSNNHSKKPLKKKKSIETVELGFIAPYLVEFAQHA